MDQEIVQNLEQNQDFEDPTESVVKHQKNNNQDSIRGIAVKISLILIIQTLLNIIAFIYLSQVESFNDNFPLLHFGILFCFYLIIAISSCALKSKQAIFSQIWFVLFFIFYFCFFWAFIELVFSIDWINPTIFLLYIIQAFLTLSIGYIYYLIYFYFAQTLFQRQVENNQIIFTIIGAIIFISTYFTLYYNDFQDVNYFQLFLGIIYFQGILILFQNIQVKYLFEIINGQYKPLPNEILNGYVYVQYRIFYICFKDC